MAVASSKKLKRIRIRIQIQQISPKLFSTQASLLIPHFSRLAALSYILSHSHRFKYFTLQLTNAVSELSKWYCLALVPETPLRLTAIGIVDAVVNNKEVSFISQVKKNQSCYKLKAKFELK